MTTKVQEEPVIAAENAVGDDPANEERYVELGMAYFHARRFDEAMRAFQHALELNPDTARAYNGIGRVYYHTGPPEMAVESYRRAFTLDPHYVDAYFGLGILYSTKVGDDQAALETIQLGLLHNPADAFLRASLGTTYARMGRFDEAIAWLQHALELDPESTYAYGWLSIIYLHQRRYDEMIATCEREIEIEDSNDARRMLGYVYDHLGRQREALAQLERSIALEPDDYEARAALARIYRTVGQEQQADEHYAIARAMAMQDDEYGQACFEAVSGNVEQAVTLLKVGLERKQLQPGWARIDPEFAFIQDDPRFRALVAT